MEVELDWPDDKEKEFGDSVTENTTDTGEVEANSGSTIIDMDDYFFQNYVQACKNVVEATSYLEIFNYSVRGLLQLPQPPPPPFFPLRD